MNLGLRLAASPDNPSYLRTAQSVARPSQPVNRTKQTFLSLPVETRLNIYHFCFFQDVHDCTNTRKERHGVHLELSKLFQQFNLLFVNRQIHSEARAIAYAAQHCFLIREHQTYYLCEPEGYTKKWTLKTQSHLQPSCRSAKALAQLRLPKLALAICEPVNRKMCFSERLALLKDFLGTLVGQLDYDMNVYAPDSLEVYLGGHSPSGIDSLEDATEVLRTARFLQNTQKPVEIVYLCCNRTLAIETDHYFVQTGKKARMYHWQDAPNGIGKRYPEDFKEFLPRGYRERERRWGEVDTVSTRQASRRCNRILLSKR